MHGKAHAEHWQRVLGDRLSAALLALLAVVFAGQGIAALQEAGSVASDPVSFISLPALIGLTLFWQRRTSRPA